MLLFWRFGETFNWLFFKYLIFFSALLIVFVIDLLHGIIPDVISLPLILLGIGSTFVPGNDVTFLSALTSGATGFGLFLLVGYAFEKLTGKEGMGGGDIKLIAAVGTFMGFAGLLFTVLFSSFSAVILMMLIRHQREKIFPYGPFIVVAAFVYEVFGNIIIARYLGLFGL